MRYHNITKDDMLNGDGLRAVLWVAGCTHKCKGCHNPVTWDIEGGIPFDDAAKEELFEAIKPDYISGVTFSGGDPLHPANHVEVAVLAKEIKETFPNKTIWLYTGFCWDEIKTLDVVKYCDVIVDGPFVQEEFDGKLHWKGSKNQRVIRRLSLRNSPSKALKTELFEAQTTHQAGCESVKNVAKF